MSRLVSSRFTPARLTTGLALAAVTALGLAGTAGNAAASSRAVSTSADRSDVACTPGGTGPAALQQSFADASRAAGVPQSVLMGVSYMESTWDMHLGQSSSGGYGPMNLTDVEAGDNATGKGDGSTRAPQSSLQTARLASKLTGAPLSAMRTDPAANLCGGAAVLAEFQRSAGHATGAGTDPATWADAVAQYSGGVTPSDRGRFVGQVYDVLRSGATRTTTNGEKVTLQAQPGLQTPTGEATAASESSPYLDCPRSLKCEWFEAPYKWNDTSDPSAYGNHDLADRPHTMNIRYIVIHDSEATWETDRQLIKDPTYISWQYTVNSLTGQVAQHVPNKDVAFQAGNWYVNMHSIGIEHTGFAAQGATWYTETMYRTSAELVRHLAREYGIPLDRAHIIGHDQVPGIDGPHVAGMHWDPGPFWNWEHYFDLLHAPIGGHQHGAAARHGWGGGHGHGHGPRRSDVVTVAPGFDHNRQPVTGCDKELSGNPCPSQGTNFVYLHQDPSTDAPLAIDEGLHTDGSPSTENISDIGARATAGQRLVVAARQGDWLGVWWLGRIAWLQNPARHPVVVPDRGATVTPAPGLASIPVYGRAFPEASAYPSTVPTADIQPISPLQYTLKAGQRYVLADADVTTDYYHSTQFPDSPGQRIDIRGTTKYYQVWIGHRQMFVQAKDVKVSR